MTPAPPSRWRLALALAAIPLLPSVAAAQSPAYSRAIPGFARPIGSADPAARVRYLGGADTLPLRTHPGGSSAPDSYLYRRAGDGAYRPVTAPGYVIVNSGCPATGAIDVRARMIDLAAAEWATFGLPVLDATSNNETAVPRADGLDIVEPQLNFALGERVSRRALRLGLMEDDDAVRATIAGYWAATGSDEALRLQALVNYGDRVAGWSQPWSAAFVSWLACESGLSPRQFRRSGRHFDYVRAAVAARDGHDPHHAYIAYDLGETRPTHGDLICAARAGSGFGALADVRDHDADESTALHCELVVKTDPVHGRLYTIGGNVAHAVTLSVLATTADGRPLNDRDVIGANRWFAVLKFRGVPDPAHDLDCTPAILGLPQSYRDYATGIGAPVPSQLPTDADRRAAGCRP